MKEKNVNGKIKCRKSVKMQDKNIDIWEKIDYYKDI